MAFVGMRYVVFAPIKTEVEGQEIQYDQGVVVGEAISAGVNITRNNEDLYGGDHLIESDNSIVGGTVDLTVDDIEDDAKVVMLGMVKDQDGKTYHEEGTATPYGGMGYIRVRRKKGKTTYQVNWTHKVQMAVATENAQTKGQNVSWQTTSVTGKMMGVKNNAELKTRFREQKIFDTEIEAVSWLNGKAHIEADAAAASNGGFNDA